MPGQVMSNEAAALAVDAARQNASVHWAMCRRPWK
jgi:hypothetical protein